MASDDERSSYYYARAGAGPVRPALAGSSSTDVAIVGGGIAGCAAALALAERGYRVTLLEAQRVGAGASGRSGGQFLAGLAAAPERLAAWVGGAAARELHGLARQGLERAKQLMRANGIAAEFAAGSLLVAVKPRQRDELLRERDLLAALGDPVPEFLERAALSERLASARYVAGLYDPSAAHGDSLLYVRALAAAAERAGASICEASRVLRLEMASPAVLHTAQGRLTAAHVLLAGNALLGPLAPPLAQRIVPVRSFIVATEALGASRASALIPCDAAVADMNRVLDYFRLSRDHRLLFGGRAGTASYERERFTRATRVRMLRVFPQLADVAIDYSWGCLVDLTLNRAPDFGRLQPHVYYVQGFCGHGLALATLSGELVAQAIAGQAERFDLFARLPRQTLPRGTPLAALLRLGLLWYRLLDALP